MGQDLKCLIGIESRRIKAGHTTILIPGLTKAGKAHTVVKRNVASEAPFVLDKCLDTAGTQVGSQVKLVLGVDLKIAKQKINPTLIGVTYPSSPHHRTRP